MEKSKIKLKTKVVDRWYPDWGIGEIIHILKTVIKIDFGGIKGVETYDYQHAIEFLETREDYKQIIKNKYRYNGEWQQNTMG